MTRTTRFARCASLVIAAIAITATAGPDEAAFLAENQAAMDRMMTAMDAKPSGEIDRDFAAMMIPHHQGAIDMAVAELRYGRNQQLRRIAQEIIVDQQQEIVAMHLALDQPLPPSTAAPTRAPSSISPDASAHAANLDAPL
jgi:histidinol dehydrogenase